MNSRIKIPEFVHALHYVAMLLLRLPRRLGAFGTPEEPIYLNTDDRVPDYVLLRYPRSLRLTVSVPAETYYDADTKFQVTRPLHETMRNTFSLNGDAPNAFLVRERGPDISGHLSAGPTYVRLSPRNGGLKRRIKTHRTSPRLSVFPQPIRLPTTI